MGMAVGHHNQLRRQDRARRHVRLHGAGDREPQRRVRRRCCGHVEPWCDALCHGGMSATYMLPRKTPEMTAVYRTFRYDF